MIASQRILLHPNLSPFNSALLLSDRHESAAIDKLALRAAGIPRIQQRVSGLDVARELAEKVSKVLEFDTEVIFCLPELEDISASEFAYLIRSHPLLAPVPLVAIAADPGQVGELKASGFTDVIVRPFNTTTLCNILHAVATRSQKDQQALLQYLQETPGVPGHEEFDALLIELEPARHEYMTPAEAYQHGISLMREYEWDKALPFLEKAASHPDTQGEASMALAAFWRVNQASDWVKEYLLDALYAFLDAHRWEKAQQAALRLHEEFPELLLPIWGELERRVRKKQFNIVIKLIEIGLLLEGKQAIIVSLLRGIETSGSPQQTLKTILSSLRIYGQADLALLLEEAAGAVPKPKRWPWSRKQKETGTKPDISHEPTSPKSITNTEASSTVPIKNIPAADTSRSTRLIKPLGQDEGDSPTSFTASPLGDALTIVKGTLRLYKDKEKK